MVLDREGVVEVSVEDPGFTAAEAGPHAADMLSEHATNRDGVEPRTFEVQGTGWI